MNRSNLLIVLFLFIFTCIYGTPTEDINIKKLTNKGNNLIEKENFEEALIVFKQILPNDRENANTNFKIRFCLYNLPGKNPNHLSPISGKLLVTQVIIINYYKEKKKIRLRLLHVSF